MRIRLWPFFSLHGAVALLLLLCTMGSAHATAKPVVLLDFDGHHGRSARRAVARLLRSEAQVVPRGRMVRAARAMRIGMRCTPEAVTGLCRALAASAAVCGEMAGNKLTLAVVSCANAAVLTRFRFTARRGAISRSMRPRVLQRLRTAMEAAPEPPAPAAPSPVAPPAAAPTPPPEPTLPDDPGLPADSGSSPAAPPADAGEPVAPARLPGERWGMDDKPNARAARDGGDKEDPLSNKKQASTPAGSASARASAGLGDGAYRLAAGPAFLLRRYYGVYNPASLYDSQGWKTTPVPGLAAHAALYPMALFRKGWMSHIGLGLSYQRYFGLGWRAANDPVEHSASHQTLRADLRGRYPMTLLSRPLVFHGRFGYRWLSFTMNEGEVRSAIPDVTFSCLELGLGASMMVLPRWLGVSASGAFLPVLGAGEVVTAEEYGPGSAYGLAGELDLFGPILWGLGWRVEFEYQMYTISFSGSPSSARHAGSAKDRYLTSLLFVTYSR